MFWSLREILKKRIREYPFWPKFLEKLIFEIFIKEIETIFGKDLNQKIKFCYFKKGTLSLKTESSVLSQEIKLRERELKERINKKIGQKILKKIHILLG